MRVATFAPIVGIVILVGAPAAGQTWRGLVIAPEYRCLPYDQDDYEYPQSVEQDIVGRLGGVWSPYTLERFGSIDDTDIEHIVATSEAHDSGLCDDNIGRRRAFARDVQNLTLASPQVIRYDKGGKDAAEWMPAENRCWFANTIVTVRRRYSSTIGQEEADALEAVLSACRSLALVRPGDDNPPQPLPPERTEQTSSRPRRDALALYDDNGNGRITSAEARRHGIAPVPRGHPAYPFMDDRDNDGTVCE